MPLTFISLFAGIGGIDLGLERAGMTCVAQVEIDDYATRVLEKHWPNVPRFKDVRGVGARNLPSADVIAGGFPCQDISNAGPRVGITGERSGLWGEYARIICELRPRYVLVENVAALLVRGIDTVLGDLAAIGYDAEWQCIPAAAVGAPHIRDRVFIVAYADSARCTPDQTNTRGVGEAHSLPPINRTRPYSARQSTRASVVEREQHTTTNQSVADADISRLAQRESFGANARQELSAIKRGCGQGSGQWAIEPAVGRMADGVPNRVDRLRGLGNAVVPQVAEFVGRAIVAHVNRR